MTGEPVPDGYEWDGEAIRVAVDEVVASTAELYDLPPWQLTFFLELDEQRVPYAIVTDDGGHEVCRVQFGWRRVCRPISAAAS